MLSVLVLHRVAAISLIVKVACSNIFSKNFSDILFFIYEDKNMSFTFQIKYKKLAC